MNPRARVHAYYGGADPSAVSDGGNYRPCRRLPEPEAGWGRPVEPWHGPRARAVLRCENPGSSIPEFGAIDMPTVAILVLGAGILLSGIFTLTGSGDLGEEGDEPPAPPRRPSARATSVGPVRIVSSEGGSTPVPGKILANRRRYAAKKFWGTCVLARQQALSMKLLVERGGGIGERAKAIMDRAVEQAEVSCGLARELDPQWASSRRG